jgi:hypothetical protein
VRVGLAGASEDGDQVHAQYALESLRCFFLGGGAMSDSRVVHEDIDPAEAIDCGPHQLVRELRLCQVPDHAVDAALVALGGNGTQLRFAAGRRDHLCPEVTETAHEEGPEARRRAGDNDDPALEVLWRC